MPFWEIRTSEIDPDEFLAHDAPLDDNPIILEQAYVLLAESRNISSSIADIAMNLTIDADSFTTSNTTNSLAKKHAISATIYTTSNNIGNLGNTFAVSSENHTITFDLTSIILIFSKLDSFITTTTGPVTEDYHAYVYKKVQTETKTETSALSKDARDVYLESLIKNKTDEYGYITVDKKVEDTFLQVSDAIDEWLVIRDDLNDFLSVGLWDLGSNIYSQTSSHAEIGLDISVSSQIFTVSSLFADALRLKGLKSSIQTISDVFGDLFVLHLRLTRIVNPEIQLIFADKYYIEIIFDSD